MRRLAFLVEEGELEPSLCSSGSSPKARPRCAAEGGHCGSVTGRSQATSGQGSGRRRTKAALPEPGFWLQPPASLSTGALWASRARGNAPTLFQRRALQSTGASAPRNAGGQPLPDMPEVSETGVLTAPKGFGCPIPLPSSSMDCDKLLENP